MYFENWKELIFIVILYYFILPSQANFDTQPKKLPKQKVNKPKQLIGTEITGLTLFHSHSTALNPSKASLLRAIEPKRLKFKSKLTNIAYKLLPDQL